MGHKVGKAIAKTHTHRSESWLLIFAKEFSSPLPTPATQQSTLSDGLLTLSKIYRYVRLRWLGYWPSSFFFALVYWPRRSRGPSHHLCRASLVNKGFIIWLSIRGHFSFGTRRVVPNEHDSSNLGHAILPAIHSTGFDSSCPLTE